MNRKRDIQHIDDVKQMVNSFYDRVRKDDLIGPIFNERIQDRWDKHLTTMYSFWDNLLFGNNTYHGRPFPPHATMPIGADHFERWLKLFVLNLDEQFEGEKTEEAKIRAQSIASIFNYKIEHLRNNNA